MPRDGEKVRRLLQRAALELYGERGYEETTAAEIAAKAGVTERTFFRHFADKREVLFDGETALADVLSRAVLEAPPEIRVAGARRCRARGNAGGADGHGRAQPRRGVLVRRRFSRPGRSPGTSLSKSPRSVRA